MKGLKHAKKEHISIESIWESWLEKLVKTVYDGSSVWMGSKGFWVRIGTEECEDALLRAIYLKYGTLISKQDLEKLITLIRLKAKGEDIKPTPPLRKVFLKGQEELIINLDNDEAVKITPAGWELIPQKFYFRKERNQLPYPKPQKEFNFNSLWELFLNTRSITALEDKALLLIWVLAFFIPDIAKPALIFEGDQGSGKTLTAKLLSRIVDSAKDKVIRKVNLRDLCVTLQSHELIVIDNLSKLTPDMCDTLAAIITGTDISERKLYTNRGIESFSVKGTFILTGIDIGGIRSDLLDRSFIIKFTRLSEESRKPEQHIIKDFEIKLPDILGAIFTTLAKALELHPYMMNEKCELRLADWYYWALSCAKALDQLVEDREFSFEDLFRKSISKQRLLLTEESILNEGERAEVLVDFLTTLNEEISVTPTELAKILSAFAKNQGKDIRFTPQGVSRLLHRLRPILIDKGFKIGERRTSTRREWILSGTVTNSPEELSNSKPLAYKENDEMTEFSLANLSDIWAVPEDIPEPLKPVLKKFVTAVEKNLLSLPPTIREQIEKPCVYVNWNKNGLLVTLRLKNEHLPYNLSCGNVEEKAALLVEDIRDIINGDFLSF